MHEVFRALGDPTRLKLVQMLAEGGEVCVCHIVEELDLNQPAVSHHMAKLKQAGLLNSRREGQWIHYSLNVEAFRSGPLAFLNNITSTAESHAELGRPALCRSKDRREEP